MAVKKKFVDIILEMKKGCLIKVYGKVKKFPINPKWTQFPRYYLDIASIVVTKKASENKNADDERIPKWKKRAFRKIRNM